MLVNISNRNNDSINDNNITTGKNQYKLHEQQSVRMNKKGVLIYKEVNMMKISLEP